MAYFIATDRKDISKRTCEAIPRSYMEVAWTSRKYCIRQRSIVCSGNDEGAELIIGNSNKTLNSLLPTDR